MSRDIWHLPRERSGMTALEAVVTVALIGAFLGVSTTYHHRMLIRAKELALAAELRNLRASLSFFEAVHHRYPTSLEELISDTGKRVQGRGGRPIVLRDQRGGGQMVDVFGGPYAYDHQTGAIRSRTKGYEFW
jgi:hypothetical protein